MTSGSTSTLSWTSSNATSFSINNYGSATPNAASSTIVSPTQTTDYTGTVSASGVINTCPATLTISCVPHTTWSCPNGTGTATIASTSVDASCNTVTNNNYATCSSPGYCVPGDSYCFYSSADFSPLIGLNTGDLSLHPSLIQKGKHIQVYWNVLAGSSLGCTVTGTDGDSWSGFTSGSTGETSAAVNQQTTYTLSCLNDDGVTYTTETQTVNIVPTYREQ